MDLWPVASSFYICIYIFRIQEKVNNFHSYGSLEKQQHWLWFPHSNDMDTWHVLDDFVYSVSVWGVNQDFVPTMQKPA